MLERPVAGGDVEKFPRAEIFAAPSLVRFWSKVEIEIREHCRRDGSVYGWGHVMRNSNHPLRQASSSVAALGVCKQFWFYKVVIQLKHCVSGCMYNSRLQLLN